MTEEEARDNVRYLDCTKDGFALVGLSQNISYPTPENMYAKGVKPKYTVEK